jgi:hypothetical protein
MGAIVGHGYGSGTGMDTFTLSTHHKQVKRALLLQEVESTITHQGDAEVISRGVNNGHPS